MPLVLILKFLKRGILGLFLTGFAFLFVGCGGRTLQYGSLPVTGDLALDSSSLTLGSGKTHAFVATLGGIPAGIGAVTFAIDGAANGATLNASTGFFQAPVVSSSTLVKIKATETTGLQRVVKCQITIVPLLALNSSTVVLVQGASSTFTPSGGVPPYIYNLNSVSFGTLSASSGASTTFVTNSSINQAGTITLTVTDSENQMVTATINVRPPVIINPISAAILQGTSRTFTASGGSGNYTFSLVGSFGSAAINATTGVLTTATAITQSLSFVVRVTDALGQTSDSNVTVDPALGVGLVPQTNTLIQSQTVTLTPSGGKPPYNFSLSNAPGALSAASGNSSVYTAPSTIDSAVPSSVTVNITDSLQRAIAVTFNLKPPVAINSPGRSLRQNDQFTFVASGGNGAYTYAIQGNANGCNIDANTGLFRTPTVVSSSFQVLVQARDGLGQVSLAQTVMVKNPPTLNPSRTLLSFNQTYSNFTPLGGEAPYTFSLLTGGDFATITSAGVVTSKATAGVMTFKVTDNLQQTVNGEVIVELPLSISPSTANVKKGDKLALNTSGGVPGSNGYTYTVSGNHGSVNVIGLYSAPLDFVGTVTITVADSLGATASSQVYIGLAISPLSPKIASRKNLTFSAVGGLAPFSFSVPANNTVGTINASTGFLTAKSNASGSTTVTVTDGWGQQSQTTITAAPALTLTAQKNKLKQGENITLTATGGDNQFTYSVSGPGSINSSGVFTAGNVPSGSPSVATTITVRDGLGQSAQTAVTIYSSVVISPSSPKVIGAQVVNFTSSGGLSPYNYALTSGLGNLAGAKYTAPSSIASNSNTIITVTDALGQTATSTLRLIPPVQLAAVTSPIVGGNTQTLVASAGDGSYTFSITSGTGPGSLSDTSPADPARKVFTAATNVAANVTVTVQVKDGTNQTAMRNINIVPPVALSVASPSAILPGASQVFTASKGNPPYSFSIVAGTLAGSLSAVSGNNSQQRFTASSSQIVKNNMRVTLRVVDSLNQTADQSLTVAGPIQFTRAGFSVVVGKNSANVPNTVIVDPTGGVAPYTFTVTSGNAGSIAFSNPDWVFTASASTSGRVVYRVKDSISQSITIPVDVLPQILPQPSSSSLSNPSGMVIDGSGNIYVTDAFNHRVIKYSPSGAYLASIGSLGSGNGQFDTPWAIAISPAGDFYVSELGNHRISIFDLNFSFKSTLGTHGTANGQFNLPGSIAFDNLGNFFVADTGNHRIQKFSAAGSFIQSVGSQGSDAGKFVFPSSVYFKNGFLYVTDSTRVQKFSIGTSIVASSYIGTPGIDYVFPSSMIIDSDGNYLILDKGENAVIKISTSNTVIATYGSQGTSYGKFSAPQSFYQNFLGQIFIVDSGNNRIQVFDKSTVFPGPPPTTTTTTLGTSARSDLNMGERLSSGQVLVPSSNSCNCQAIMQTDGNFVIFKGSSALWNTGTSGNQAAYLVFQNDSNLVIFNSSTPKWNSQTYGKPALRLRMQPDCNLTLLSADLQTVLWNSGTSQSGCQ